MLQPFSDPQNFFQDEKIDVCLQTRFSFYNVLFHRGHEGGTVAVRHFLRQQKKIPA